MKYYYDYLKKNKFKVSYLEYKDKFKLDNCALFNPIDKLNLPGKFKIVESPNFILTEEHYKKYRKKTTKFFFNAFYMWGKKEINVLPDVKSQDKYNRKSIPKNIKIPKLDSLSTEDKKYIKEAQIYIDKNFPKNYGTTENFVYPVTHKSALKWLKSFIKNKFKLFGDYQDAILKGESYNYHSVLSSSINIGLLNPNEIIKEIMNKKKSIPLNSLEGYIRQLFWREYQRYCYLYYNFDKKNYFGNNKKLTKEWYLGTTGIDPIDDCIKKAFDTAYLHHIERLMVIGNYMNLCEIHPREAFKWFMEFSIDSYEWVMHQNVLDMVFFVSGGATMRRPYSSSSNYIMKMSNHKKGEWNKIWDIKYENFINKNKKKLWKFRYYFPALNKKT